MLDYIIFIYISHVAFLKIINTDAEPWLVWLLPLIATAVQPLAAEELCCKTDVMCVPRGIVSTGKQKLSDSRVLDSSCTSSTKESKLA